MVACLALVAGSAAISVWHAVHGSTFGARAWPSAWDMALTFLLTGGIPFLWLVRTRARPIAGTLDYLRLRNLGKAAPWGVALGVAMAVVAMVALRTLPGPLPSVATFIRVGLFFGVMAPLGEEILFRGILQPRIGVLAQAAAFAIMHVAGVTPLQGVLVLLFGIALGLAAKRWGLWTSIVAHGTYNLVALL